MKIKELLNQRNELLTQGETLVNEGKFEEFNALEEQVNALDAQIEATKLAQANLQALKGSEVAVDLENKSEIVEGEKVMGNLKVESTEKLYENAFGKTLLGQELTAEENNVFMEMNNHTTATAGVTIPETTMNEILSEIYAQNPFLGDVRKLTIKGNVSLPKHTAITSGDAAAYLESEATAEEVNAFAEIQLTGKEVAKYLTVSFKLEAMSIPALLDYLKTEIVERVGAELGRQAINGNGVKEMTGVLTALASVTAQKSSYAAADGIDYAKILEVVGKLGAKHASNAVFYADNATVWTKLASIVDGEGRPYFIADTTAGGVGRILGFPVKVDSAVPAGTVIFGDAKGYVINTNEAVSVESDRDIKARKTGFSAYTIVDGNVTHEKAFSILAPGA